MKKARYAIEAALLAFIMFIFRLMPPDAASACGGAIGRAIGPRLAASRKARRNLHDSFSGHDERQIDTILTGMWDNLGRVMAEYPHLKKIGRDRVEFDIAPAAQKILDDNTPCLMIGAHLANWEAGGAAMALRLGKQIDLTYRAPNNPLVDRMLMKARTLNGQLKAYPKSRAGGQNMIRAMREGRNIGFLIDQKYNEGIAVDFFGRPAMTNPVFVQLAHKFDDPVLLWTIERLRGVNFKITIHPPLETTGKTAQQVIAHAHELLENFIGKQPEQWLWLHRRWDSQKIPTVQEAA